MHIGIEVKKFDTIIVSVDGNRKNLVGTSQIKLSLDNDSIAECIDFKKSFEMFINENSITQISLITGGSDSSKVRIVIEYLIQEIGFSHNIRINTYASSALKKLKEKYEKEMAVDFKQHFLSFGLNVYSEKSYLVAWRFS
jgi:hypothetical protein